jgi:hypothetical protein
MSGRKSRAKRKEAPDYSGDMPEGFRFKPVKSVPGWAHFLSFDLFVAFQHTIERALHERMCWFVDKGHAIELHFPSGDIGLNLLETLAKKCCAEPVERFPEIVGAYYDQLFEEVEGEAEDDEDTLEPTFENVKEHLKIRIYTDAFLSRSSPEAPPLVKRLAPNLNATLVIDMPHMAFSVTKEVLTLMDVTKEKAFQTAVDNHQNDEVQREELHYGEFQAFSLLSDTRYCSSQLLHLARHLKGPAPWGALVVLFHRDTLTCCPIDPRTLPACVIHMVLAAHRGYEKYRNDEDPTLPGSADLYWWRPDRIVHIPAGWKDDLGAVVMPDEEFLHTIFGSVRPNQLGGKLPV